MLSGGAKPSVSGVGSARLKLWNQGLVSGALRRGCCAVGVGQGRESRVRAKLSARVELRGLGQSDAGGAARGLQLRFCVRVASLACVAASHACAQSQHPESRDSHVRARTVRRRWRMPSSHSVVVQYAEEHGRLTMKRLALMLELVAGVTASVPGAE
eukprot:3808883-Rhodomonas_salina.2